jgi:hypothetical protein
MWRCCLVSRSLNSQYAVRRLRAAVHSLAGDNMSQPKRQLSRRTLFAGAGTIGAAAAAVSLLPGVRPQDPSPADKPQTPSRGGGYHMSEHIRKYFKTTLI